MQWSSVTSSDSFMISTSESSVISSAMASKLKPEEQRTSGPHSRGRTREGTHRKHPSRNQLGRA